MCYDRLVQVGHDVSLLQTQRAHDCQKSLHQTTTRFAVTTSAPLAPQYCRTQGPLGSVVRRLNTLDPDECPQRRFQTQQVPAHRCRLDAAALEASLEHLSKPGPLTADIPLQTRTPKRPIADPVPPAKEIFEKQQKFSADVTAFIIAVDHRLEIPFQMSPAQLPLIKVQTVVGTPAVAGNQTVNPLAQKSGQALPTPASVDDKAGDGLCDRRPQPASAASLFPTGLVDVPRRSRSDGSYRLGMGTGQSLTGLLLGLVNGPDGDGHLEKGLDDFFQSSLGEVLAAIEVR